MKPIFSLFWYICTFRAGPDRVPANTTFLGVIIILNILLNVALFMLLNDVEFIRVVTLVVVNLTVTAGLIWVVMMLMDVGARYQKTLTALFGADLILSTITNLIAWGVQQGFGDSATNVQFFIIALLFMWTLGVYGFVFHRALNLHIGFGIAIALFVIVFALAISQTAVAV